MKTLLLRLATERQGTVPLAYTLLGSAVSMLAVAMGLFYKAEYLLRLLMNQMHTMLQ